MIATKIKEFFVWGSIASALNCEIQLNCCFFLVKSENTDLYLVKFGERIVSLRKKYGITQLELARRMDIENANLRKIERGKKNVTISTLLKLSDAFEISIREIFDFD